MVTVRDQKAFEQLKTLPEGMYGAAFFFSKRLILLIFFCFFLSVFFFVHNIDDSCVDIFLRALYFALHFFFSFVFVRSLLFTTKTVMTLVDIEDNLKQSGTRLTNGAQYPIVQAISAMFHFGMWASAYV